MNCMKFIIHETLNDSDPNLFKNGHCDKLFINGNEMSKKVSFRINSMGIAIYYLTFRYCTLMEIL
jgi:hypothetical protein